MNKSKEYFKALEENNVLEHSVKAAFIVMNHMTLEDVKELIKDRIDELGNGQISLEELENLKI